MWIIYGLLSAIFAAIASIFDKIGAAKIDSNLATALRTSIIVLMSWSLVFTTQTQYYCKGGSGRRFNNCWDCFTCTLKGDI